MESTYLIHTEVSSFTFNVLGSPNKFVLLAWNFHLLFTFIFSTSILIYGIYWIAIFRYTNQRKRKWLKWPSQRLMKTRWKSIKLLQNVLIVPNWSVPCTCFLKWILIKGGSIIESAGFCFEQHAERFLEVLILFDTRDKSVWHFSCLHWMNYIHSLWISSYPL